MTHAAEGERAEAAASTAKSLEIRFQMTKGNERQQDYSSELEKIGEAWLDAGDVAVALAKYEESLTVRRQYAEEEPNDPDRQSDLAQALATVGDLKLRSGDAEGARNALQENLDIRQRLADRDKTTRNSSASCRRRWASLGYAKYPHRRLSGRSEPPMPTASPSRAKLAEVEPNAGKQRDHRPRSLPASATPSSTPATMPARSRPTGKASPSASSSPPRTPATPI